MLKVPWLAAMKYAEDKDEGPSPVNATRFEEWFEGKGGQTSFVYRDTDAPVSSRWGGGANPLGVLTAEEDVHEGDVLLQVPLKLILNQLSLRTRRMQTGYLGEKLSPVFAHNQEWGLAVALLHEYTQDAHGGDSSKWAPFIHTLKMRLLGTSLISQELAGTYASQSLKLEEEEVHACHRFVAQEFCKKDSTGICKRRAGRIGSGDFTR